MPPKRKGAATKGAGGKKKKAAEPAPEPEGIIYIFFGITVNFVSKKKRNCMRLFKMVDNRHFNEYVS